MAGLLGALYLLACGGAYAYKDITESRENNEARERARIEGKKYYYATDGERAVDTNHRVMRLPDGVKDMQTGQWLYDKKKEDAKKRRELSELDEIEKKEAIIKGKNTYWCTLHESDPRRNWRNVGKRYQRLINNDMPVQSVLKETLGIGENKIWYTNAKELSFHFNLPVEYNLETKDKVFEWCKDWNMEFIMKSLCKTYPINEVEVIYNYCQKYNIPIGTWNEIEAMMLEEQPLGWRKVPPSKDWQFENFMNHFIM